MTPPYGFGGLNGEQKYVLCLPVGNTPISAELVLQEGVFFNQDNEPLLMADGHGIAEFVRFKD